MATHMLRRGRHAGRVTRNVGDSGARRGERGAALVEAAIVTPLLLMLVFGIIEFGFAFKDTLTLANGSRSGARVASAAGTDPSADWFVLQAVKGATGSLANVNEIVVFKATGPNGVVPASCASGTPSGGSCNVYMAADYSSISQPFCPRRIPRRIRGSQLRAKPVFLPWVARTTSGSTYGRSTRRRCKQLSRAATSLTP